MVSWHSFLCRSNISWCLIVYCLAKPTLSIQAIFMFLLHDDKLDGCATNMTRKEPRISFPIQFTYIALGLRNQNNVYFKALFFKLLFKYCMKWSPIVYLLYITNVFFPYHMLKITFFAKPYSAPIIQRNGPLSHIYASRWYYPMLTAPLAICVYLGVLDFP